MNDCIRNKAGVLIGLFTLLGGFTVSAQDIAVKTNLLYGGVLQTPNIGMEWGISPKLTVDLWGAYNPFPLGKNGYGSNNRKMKHWLINLNFAIGFVNGLTDISWVDICFMDNTISVIFDMED